MLNQTLAKNDNKRLVYLDLIKTLSIYLVCLYHFNHFRVNILEIEGIGVYRNYFLKGLASTAVPLFIMVNGHLMLNSKKKFDLKKHINKVLRLVLITFLWGAILLIAASFIKDQQYTVKSFMNALWTWEAGTINHLWYLNALIGIYLLYPIIKELYDKQNRSLLYYFLGLTFILTFGNVFMNIIYNIVEFIQGKNVLINNGYNFFNNINIFREIPAYTFVYFIVGGLLGKYIEENSQKIKIHIPIMALIIGQTALFGYAVIMTISNNTNFDIVFDGYNTIMTLVMSISIFIISFKKERILNSFSKMLYMVGNNTLGIYLMHVIVGWSTIEYYRQLPYSTNIILNLLYAATVVSISLVLSIILGKIPILKNLLKI